MCDGCHAKGACPSAKGENRVVSVESDQSSGLSLGDSVEVGVSYQVGAIAVLLAYIVPLLLFVLTILGVVLLGLDEAVAALLGFALTTLYYVWLYSIRDKMRRVVRFYIKRK